MAQGNWTTQQTVFVCMACRSEVVGTFSFEIGEITVDRMADKTTAEVTLKGIRVDHNCIPAVTRGQVHAD